MSPENSTEPRREERTPASRHLLLWLLFFAICLGLGYPTLNRYDPGLTAGTGDSMDYARLVTGWRLNPAESGEHSHRILIPYVAKPFYWAAKGRVGSWDPARFGLLASNSLFCATSASLLVLIGSLVAGGRPAGLLSGALYLMSFAVPNWQLSGLVDSGESCAITALAFCMLKRRFKLFPVIGALGALSKETFVPIGGAFALAWCWRSGNEDGVQSERTAWTAAMIAAGLMAVTGAQTFMAGTVAWPLEFAASMRSDGSFLRGLQDSVFAHGIFYSFAWLLPLGLWRLNRLPPAWVFAAACSACVALVLSAYHGAGGNAARPMFNAAGPLLVVSAALLILDQPPAKSRPSA